MNIVSNRSLTFEKVIYTLFIFLFINLKVETILTSLAILYYDELRNCNHLEYTILNNVAVLNLPSMCRVHSGGG